MLCWHRCWTGTRSNRSGRHDHKLETDPRLNEIVAELQRRRKERWRDPAEVGMAERIARVYGDAVSEAGPDS
jgi:hypothetical protein